MAWVLLTRPSATKQTLREIRDRQAAEDRTHVCIAWPLLAQLGPWPLLAAVVCKRAGVSENAVAVFQLGAHARFVCGVLLQSCHRLLGPHEPGQLLLAMVQPMLVVKREKRVRKGKIGCEFRSLTGQD